MVVVGQRYIHKRMYLSFIICSLLVGDDQVILSGLHLSLALTENTELRASVRRLDALFEETVRPLRLNGQVSNQVHWNLSRLTKVYEPAFILVLMLMQGRSVSLQNEDDTTTILPGFLFDMNKLWE
ncbi:MAG: hypothetical protein CL607_00415 [Anaerolineaceae bacterium]|nr:hypothetical protein [Anaerolineaceae bacterium]